MSMFHNKNYKPNKQSWFNFYVKAPIIMSGDLICEGARIARRKLIGGWYCEHCNCFHGRRVYKYIIKIPGIFVNQTEWEVCSVGYERFKSGEWKPTQQNLILAAAQALSGTNAATRKSTSDSSVLADEQAESEEYYEDRKQSEINS